MIGARDVLIAQEQHLVIQQCLLDRTEQIVIPRGFGQVDAAQFSPDVLGEALDLHSTNTDEPMVLPASRSRWACTH